MALLTIIMYAPKSIAQGSSIDTTINNWIVQQYTIIDGLKQMQIEDIHFGKNGLMWIATRGGVCTYDGNSFDKFVDLENKPIYAKKIIETSDGRIIIDAGKSFYSFNGQSFRNYRLPKSFKSTTHSHICIDWADNIWIQNRLQEDLLVFKDSIEGANDRFDHPFFKRVMFVIPDNETKCYYGIENQKRILKYCGDDITIVYETTGKIHIWKYFLFSNNPHGFQFSIDRKAHHFFEFKTNKTHSFDFLEADFQNLDKTGYNFQIDHRPSNSLYVTIEGKMATLLNDIQKKYNHFLTYELYKDFHYIGTNRGLLKVSKSQFTTKSDRDLSNVFFVSENNEELIFGVYGKGLITNSGKPFRYDSTFNHKDEDLVKKCIYYSPTKIGQDSLLIGTENGLILLHNYEASHVFPSDIDDKKTILFPYYDQERQVILLASCQGIILLNKDFKTIKTIKERLFEHRCLLTITKDMFGKYWIAGSGGIAMYDLDMDTLTNYTYDQGTLPIQGASCSLTDWYGNIWFGGTGGLTMYDINKSEFHKVDQLRNFSFSSIIQVDSMKYLLNTLDGLMMADLSNYKKDKLIQFNIYNNTNGFDALEPGQNGLYQDKEGLVWTTSSTNIISFNPDNLEYNSEITTPYVKNISGLRLAHQTPLEIERGISSVKINFGAIGNGPTTQTVYRMKLNKEKWSSWTKETSKEFQNLSSGIYDLKLQAKYSSSDDRDATMTAANFIIDLPLQKEPYFNNLILVLFLTTIGILIWLFQKRKNDSELNDILQERNDLLAEKNQNLLTEREKLTQLNDILSNNLESLKVKQVSQTTKIIKISSFDKSYSINPNQLLYLQSDKKITKLTLLDKPVIWSNESLKANYALMKDLGFFQIQRSTVINVTYIDWVNTNTLKMVNGEVLKIGRAYKTPLKLFIQNLEG